MPDNSLKTVMVAEDDKFLMKVYKVKLNKAGYNVVTATNGEAALELAVAEKPDIILLDIVMPKKSGLEVLEELRANPDFQKTPIVLLSNLSQEVDIDKATALGANGYLVKSNVQFKEVITTIEEHLAA